MNECIAGWRASLTGGSVMPAHLDELESHLRDSADQLSRSGLTPEESFLIAARRVGGPSELDRQYAAVHPDAAWRSRATWMIAGVLGYWIVTGVASALSKLVLVATGQAALDGTTLGLWGALVYLLALIGFGWLLFRYVRGRMTRSSMTGKGDRSVGMILGLAAASLVGFCADLTLDLLAAKMIGPRTLGGYALATAYFMAPLNFLTVVAFGVWIAWRKLQTLQRAGAVAILMLLSITAGCSPEANPDASAAPASATPASAAAAATDPTPFEQAFALLATDPAGAVDAFMKLDLSTGRLFTFGMPLSYSEAQFAGLSQPMREKISEPMMADITQVKRLIGAVKDRRDQAKANKETELAERYSKQLSALGTRLQGAENLKLTQLVGQSASRVAAQ